MNNELRTTNEIPILLNIAYRL